ncbi:uncharacterized protein PHACADRAFT_196318 [Phanerochaete carnosa HHB-10118-sp]|uniref:Uncharacterized protein n=1 Tax=Phanerochaete carnosa (strain HHB-10118-sp) TaxID=650164 RepID=K5UV63_PHACS|nr:uncharacterized protein PHACADRAFT_196318 [Phanerochaete carnosa HHB-10118-sp]EKM53876.1 hypothetical protein PHACADRAFT_196318 [Phanerochaete carnosa HHB-10118-sp]
MPPKDPSTRRDQRLRICHCGIYCKIPTEVADTTYRRHQDAVKAISGTVLPSFDLATPALQAMFAQKSAENANLAQETAASSRKRTSTDRSHKSSHSKRRKVMDGVEAEGHNLSILGHDEEVQGSEGLQGGAQGALPHVHERDRSPGSHDQVDPSMSTLDDHHNTDAYDVPVPDSLLRQHSIEPYSLAGMPDDYSTRLDAVQEDFQEQISLATLVLHVTVADEQLDPDTFPSEETGELPVLRIETLKIAQQFIDMLSVASLDDNNLSSEALERLRNPPQELLDLSNDVLRLLIEIYLSLDNAADDIYERVRQSIAHTPPHLQMLSLDQVKRRVREISGVYPLFTDMCVNSCVGFTGPFTELDKCPGCGESRWDNRPGVESSAGRKARQQFLTNPVGPQVQAAWRSHEGASAMKYRQQCTKWVLDDLRKNSNQILELNDWIHGFEYIEAVNRGDITKNSTTLMLSLDGAQLYCNKQSDCWMYIWVLLDRSPDSRYKKHHVLIRGVILGPNKPKNIDSFLFPGFPSAKK